MVVVGWHMGHLEWLVGGAGMAGGFWGLLCGLLRIRSELAKSSEHEYPAGLGAHVFSLKHSFRKLWEGNLRFTGIQDSPTTVRFSTT